jgi:ADP-heptose:LPS heptosyltransferase
MLDRLPPGSRIAVIRLRSLGDCVLTTPALSLLKAHRPDLRVALVVEDRFASIFEGNPDVETTIRPTLAALRAWKPDATVNLHGGTRSMTLTAASGARYRAGFVHHRFAFLYTHKIPRAQEIMGVERKVHTAEHVASVFFFLGVPQTEVPRARLFAAEPADVPAGCEKRRSEGDRPLCPRPLCTADESVSGGDREVCPLRFAFSRTLPGGYAVIHPFASAPEKTWPLERFLAVAEHIESQLGLTPVFIPGPGEPVNVFGRHQVIADAPIPKLKGIMSEASLFVGNDSGPAHIAAAYGVPCVVVFGPTDPAVWFPWRTECRTLQMPGGIQEVSLHQVIEAVDAVKPRVNA